MSYAALISLKNTIVCCSDSTIFPGKEVLGNVLEAVHSLIDFMKYDWSPPRTREKADHVLERQIADAIYRLEDVLEPFTSIENVKREISCFLETAIEIKKKIHLRKTTTIAEDPPPAGSTNINLTASNNELNMMVGFEEEILQLTDRLIGSTSKKLDILPIVGMPGIGKTTLVKQVCSLTRHHFDKYAFVTIGQTYSIRKILLDILVQIAGSQVDEWDEEDNDQLRELINRNLKDLRYLLVLEDIWSILTIRYDLKMLLPDDNCGSRIVITTTLTEVAFMFSFDLPHRMRFMSLTESWALLQKVVFAEGESCPLELESIGRKIAQNSQGLPVEITWVGSLLSKREKTTEFWKEVAENYDSYIMAYDDEMSLLNKLYPSYENLDQHLKACFLYMGVFPINYDIPASKLFGLWVSEGFLEPYGYPSLEQVAKCYLQELVDTSIVMSPERRWTGDIKTCRVHHLYWHLCVIEAEKINFFHVINGHANVFPNATDLGRRLCIRKNIVLAIKNVQELGSVSKARSLLCMGNHHQYPLPVCFEIKLLRVLDVLSIRFYNFPIAILKLIQLRYLAVTFNGELPASISVLGMLRTLIVRPHIRIRSCRSNPSFLPMDILKMKELRHLYIIGCDLPNPCGVPQLSNLQILSGVSPQSCTIGVLTGIQQLKKLGIRIELTPSDDVAEPICPFDNLFLLHKLESIKCMVVNPNFGAQIIKVPDFNSGFSDSIKKMSLSGCRLPWHDMKKISWLPRLQVLKLREHAFTGAVWETSEDEFPYLTFLLVESTDLVSWTTNESFPHLESLILKHCYQLEEIPFEIGGIQSLELIELFNCSRSASDKVEQIVKEQTSFGNEWLQVRVTFST